MERSDIIFYEREIQAEFSDEERKGLLLLEQDGHNINMDSKIRMARIVNKSGKEIIYLKQITAVNSEMFGFIPRIAFNNKRNIKRLEKFRVVGFDNGQLREVWETCANNYQNFPINFNEHML